jgi:hypothetical protein
MHFQFKVKLSLEPGIAGLFFVNSFFYLKPFLKFETLEKVFCVRDSSDTLQPPTGGEAYKRIARPRSLRRGHAQGEITKIQIYKNQKTK